MTKLKEMFHNELVKREQIELEEFKEREVLQSFYVGNFFFKQQSQEDLPDHKMHYLHVPKYYFPLLYSKDYPVLLETKKRIIFFIEKLLKLPLVQINPEIKSAVGVLINYTGTVEKQFQNKPRDCKSLTLHANILAATFYLLNGQMTREEYHDLALPLPDYPLHKESVLGMIYIAVSTAMAVLMAIFMKPSPILFALPSAFALAGWGLFKEGQGNCRGKAMNDVERLCP